MSIVDYFRASHQARIKLRATDLNCMKLINKERMRLAEEPTKRRKLNSGGSSSSSSSMLIKTGSAVSILDVTGVYLT